MSDLLITSTIPNISSGSGLRTYGVAAALARHGPVEVAFVPFGGTHPAAAFEAVSGLTLRSLGSSRGLRRGAEYARARLRGVPGGYARGVSPAFLPVAAAAPAGTRVIADGLVVAAGLLRLARERELVFLAHNLESAFRADAVPEGFERRVLRAFSESWMATRADARGAVELAGEGISPRYVPNVVDVEKIEPVTPAGGERALFVGDFTYVPNREALDFLLEQVMPLAWAQRPGLRLAVAGRGLPDAGFDERVEVLGFVDDLRGEYARADLVTVPLLHGGGSPYKLIEGLAYGLPVVSTVHAAGLLEDVVAGEHLLTAGDAEGFAEAIERLLADPGRARSIGAAGRDLVARSYSVEALATLLRP
jgi:glycosyltransferase involved in cell wall biosynthesis